MLAIAWNPVAENPVPQAGAETRICAVDDLSEGQSLKFRLRDRGRDVPCFLICFEGQLYAYVNECRHVSMTLDWTENQFFTEEGTHLFCPSHGAWYEPRTGECVEGPPCGKKLYRVPLRQRGGDVLALPPEWESDGRLGEQ